MDHGARDHALLSPSSAKRWINCTPSAKLADAVPPKNSIYADEGTFAHEMAEYALTQWLKGLWEPILDECIIPAEEKRAESPFMSIELLENVRKYCEFVIDANYEMQKTDGECRVKLESKVDISKYAPESFGSVDASLISDKTIHIIDLKYGAGVKVSAVYNEQMMLYALGSLKGHPKVEKVIMTIAQVRMDHFDTFEMSVKELKKWAKDVLTPAAKAAFEGAGVQMVGEWCRFCPVKSTCRAQYEEVLKDFERSPEPMLLDDNEMAELLTKLDTYRSWIESVNSFAYSEAMNGKKWPGFKLVAGRSSRVIRDEETLRQQLLEEYLEDEVLNIKLKGITDLEKLVGKKVFAARFGNLIESKAGAPKLVPESHKGEELNPLSDFDIEG